MASDDNDDIDNNNTNINTKTNNDTNNDSNNRIDQFYCKYYKEALLTAVQWRPLRAYATSDIEDGAANPDRYYYYCYHYYYVNHYHY